MKLIKWLSFSISTLTFFAMCTISTTKIESRQKPSSEHMKETRNSNLTEFNNAILKQHNFYRNIGGITPMKWSSKIEINAQKWANYLKKRNNCKMKHSSHGFRNNKGGYSYLGENLYWAWSSRAFEVNAQTGVKSVDSWYSEIADFKYSAKGVVCRLRGKRGMIGHFTQVMWEKSTSLGCAYATCGNGKSVVVVCQYGPGGNFNQRTNPPFSSQAADKLNKHKINRKYGGLPRCD